MSRTKSDDSNDATIRWRDRHETLIRLERLALFYDTSWNKLAAGVLVGYAYAQEQKHGLSTTGPVDDLPRIRYPSVAALPPLARARYDFYTAQLEQLHRATSPEERATIAGQEFVLGRWLQDGSTPPKTSPRAKASGSDRRAR